MLGQNRRRGAAIMVALFLVLVVFGLITVQLANLRANSGFTLLQAERTKRLFLARGAVNQLLSQLISDSEDTSPVSYEEDGYQVEADLVPAETDPNAPPPDPNEGESFSIFYVVGKAYPIGQPQGAVTSEKVVKRLVIEGGRKFVNAPAFEMPGNSLPTLFAYDDPKQPWRALEPMKYNGNLVRHDDIQHFTVDPAGTFYAYVDLDPNDAELGALLSTEESVLGSGFGGWEVFAEIKPGLRNPGAFSTEGEYVYMAHGRDDVTGDKAAKDLQQFVSVMIADDGGSDWQPLGAPKPGEKVNFLLFNTEINAGAEPELLAQAGGAFYFREPELGGSGWTELPTEATNYYDEAGELVDGEVELTQVGATIFGLFGISERTGPNEVDTVYQRVDGKWEALPPIYDWYIEGGVMKRRPGYATNISEIITHPTTGMVWARLNPPEGPVDYPLLSQEKVPPVAKQYYTTGSDPPELVTEPGYYSITPVVAAGDAGDFVYVSWVVLTGR